jgi:hypothetical protein
MVWYILAQAIHLRAYGIRVNDDLFDTSQMFGIDSDHAFIPFDTTGGISNHVCRLAEWKKTTVTVVHLESSVPTEWEKTHLPILLLTSEDWNQSQVVLRDGDRSREFKEMRMIHSLTSGMTRGNKLTPSDETKRKVEA